MRPLELPSEWIVHDAPSRCPYLPGQTARLPLRLPARRLGHEDFAQRLRQGDRRQGLLLYRPNCPSCSACEPIRIEVDAFRPSATQKRVLRRADKALEVSIARPSVTAERVALYNRHKVERGLLIGDELLDAAGYEQFLVDSCTDTIEITYSSEGTLVGVALADRAADALSAVYCYFDPTYSHLSPGTYSILTEIELCRRWGLRYLYLGLYVAGSAAMAYKASYLPHQRLIDRRWRNFRRE